ncbi:hypothetical protein HZH68_012184 [Vespula germanica]|uniref:Uncharacterized protein n=1 Tax=Vespula germanica TaxID=30212 RepID=A0A834JNE9_VESGE|nr:hypothetical protein HZH68_012184 [Vespula germanica]
MEIDFQSSPKFSKISKSTRGDRFSKFPKVLKISKSTRGDRFSKSPKGAKISKSTHGERFSKFPKDLDAKWGYSLSTDDNKVVPLTDFTVTSSVVLWTSTREHRNFRRVPLERVLTKSVHFDFALSEDFENIFPRLDLEIFALSGTLKFCLHELRCEVGIPGFERRQQTRAFDRLLQLLVQLCFGLRRGNIEIFAGLRNFHTFGDFDILSPRVDLEIFTPLGDFENLSPRLDLEIFTPLEDKIYFHEWT